MAMAVNETRRNNAFSGINNSPCLLFGEPSDFHDPVLDDSQIPPVPGISLPTHDSSVEDQQIVHLCFPFS